MAFTHQFSALLLFSAFFMTCFLTGVLCETQKQQQQQKHETPAPIAEKTGVSTHKCYQCNSATQGQEDCGESDLAKLKPYIKVCPAINVGSFASKDANSCRKVLQTVDNNSTVIRECAYTGDQEIDGKRRTGNKGILLFLYQCFNKENEQPCNGAATTTVVGAVGLLVVAMLAFVLPNFHLV